LNSPRILLWDWWGLVWCGVQHLKILYLQILCFSRWCDWGFHSSRMWCCNWVSGVWHFKGTSGTAHSVTQHHIPVHQNSQVYVCQHSDAYTIFGCYIELCCLQLHLLDVTTWSLCFLTKTPVCINVWYTWLQEITTGSTHLSSGMSTLGDISKVRSTKWHLELVVPQDIMSQWNCYKGSLALPCYFMVMNYYIRRLVISSVTSTMWPRRKIN